jgi:RNA polymerase sigma-70 factor (ECF subfamily)
MHDIQGMTHADIAKALHCTEGTVRSRLFYARRYLQALLSDYL